MHAITLLALLPAVLAAPTPTSQPAPFIQPRGAQLIPGKYIVKLKDGVASGKVDAALNNLGAVKADHVYRGAFKGFSSKLDAKSLDAVRHNPDVEYVEQDAIFTINEFVEQASAPWGLARISHQTKGSTSYVYDDSAGEGTCSYVVDTGIFTNHTQFEGRAEFLYNAVDSSPTDGHGHGTHVAGTIGAAIYGVAKKTKLYAVKVLNSSGSGTTAGVIAGMNFVTADVATRSCPKGAVANMSLGGSFSAAINAAAKAMVEAGVFLAVAAGNSNDNSANYSPASEPTVCTVGSTDSADARSSFSNYGALVDIFAPGTNILSTWIGSSGTATNTISGTSMATPHVVGLAAYLLGLLGAKAPQELCTYIANTGTAGVLSGVPSGTVNVLAFNGNPSS